MAKKAVKKQKQYTMTTAQFIQEEAKKIVWEQTRIRFQMALDAACIAAHEVFQMGAGRSAKFVAAYNKAMNDIAELIAEDAPADRHIVYSKETLDRVLRPIIGDENFLPFNERYGAGIHLDDKKRIRAK